MPVYLNTKNIFTIPRDDESDIFDNEAYLTDPEMFFDQLPQPFRLINKIVNIICNDAWSKIVENIENKKKIEKKNNVENVTLMGRLPTLDVIQCMCSIGENQLMTGNKNGIIIWNIEEESQNVLDTCSEDGMNVCVMKMYNFIEKVNIVATINEDGSARIMAVILGRIYFIKEFACSREGEKPLQVIDLYLDESCGTLCLSFDQIGGEEQWLEVYRVNKEAWSKELGAASKQYQEYLSTQSGVLVDESVAGDINTSEPIPVLDRNGVRVTPPTIIMKMKYPDSLGAAGISNINQLHKQLDTSGQCIGLGINHCITKNVIDGRIKASNLDNEASSETESHIMRAAHITFLKSVGSLITDIINDENAAVEVDPAMILVWWSESQHLLMYRLNKTLQKDPWTKPDVVRSFSCAITVCEVSSKCTFVSVGLQNGCVILIEISSGLTRIVKKVSSNAITNITFLQYQESEHVQFINILDQKQALYCLKLNLSEFRDNNECVLLESYGDVKSITRINHYDIILSFHRDGGVVVRDMFSGTALFNIDLPPHVTISRPWNPLLAFVGGQYLCLQANVDDDDENSEVHSTTLLYKLDLDQLQYVDKSPLPSKEVESKSYIIEIADEYLLRRHGLHYQRQNCLQQCLANLHQYLKPAIVQ